MDTAHSTHGLAQRLDAVGFYATANDVRRGLDVAEVVMRLRRDAPGRQPASREAVLALADELEASHA